MKNPYQNLTETIPVPEGLEGRVLAAARRKAGRGQPRPVRRIFRGAVCGALALVFVLGTLTLREPGPDGKSGESQVSGGAGSPPLALSFGLTAYAAETGETTLPNANSGLAFSMGESMRWTEREGFFTGCLLQVTGEGIRHLTLALDRGEFYRWDSSLDPAAGGTEALWLSWQDGAEASFSGGAEKGQGMARLGGEVSEAYDPEARYGFWTSGVSSEAWREDTREAAYASVDQLDGATLTVTAEFEDGSSQTKIYTLSTGFLKISASGGALLPQLEGDGEASLYGIYTVDQAGSRWFRWPVPGNNTIRLSAPYGPRTAPGGKAASFHDGIDIPAPSGTGITAAASGTVKEAAFDAKLGHYLVLDHGDGLETLYAHCLSLGVKAGDRVEAGERIAAVGSTGMSTGPHLHFGVRQEGAPQDPTAYFDSGVRATLSVK